MFLNKLMYIKIKGQEEIIREAIKKAGGYRQLSKIIKIPLSSITNYIEGDRLPEKRFDSLINFLGIKNRELLIEEELEDNFRQKIGGFNCVIAKKKKGTFDRDMKVLQNIQSKKFKQWHKRMKNESPREYYNIQYSRFKKVGSYKYTTKKGEKVRNILEKQTADILFEKGIDYEYEPLVNIDKRYFFPDFLVNENIIIECTMWRGNIKAYKLKEKINLLKNKFQVYVLIPKALYTYYKILNNHLILGLDEFVLVAQTFINNGRSNR